MERTMHARGRPPQDRHVVTRRIVDAATAVLLQEGFREFTIERVAREAGVAKKTIYAIASNREELVGLIIRDWANRLPEILNGSLFELDESEEPRAALTQHLHQICAVALSSDAIAFFRLLCGDALAREQLMSVYTRNGIARGHRYLSGWMKSLQVHGKMKSFDTDLYADLLLSAVIAEPLRQAAIGLRGPYVPEELELSRRIESCVEVFAPRMFA